MKRREFITLLGGAAAWPLVARAQQPVGVLAPQSQAASARHVEAFRKGLRDLGYVEGRNITLEFRYGDGLPERLPQLGATSDKYASFQSQRTGYSPSRRVGNSPR